MAQAKILANYDTNGVTRSQSTGSGLTNATTQNDKAEYYDPLTQSTTYGENGQEVIDALQANSQTLITTSDLQSKINAGQFKGDIRSASGNDWSELAFDLSQYPDPIQARRVIIDALKNPNYIAVKNQGRGVDGKPRFQDILVQGDRAVEALPVHFQSRAETHFQIFVHARAINHANQSISPRTMFSDSHIRDAEEKHLNACLASAGLAQVQIITPSSSTTQPAILQAVKAVQAFNSAPTQTNTTAALSLGSVSTPLDAHSIKTHFDDEAQAQEQVAAKLMIQAEKAAKQSKLFSEASKAVEAAEVLKSEKSALEVKVSEIEADNVSLIKDVETIAAEKIELEMLKDSEIATLNGAIEATVLKLTNTTADLEEQVAEREALEVKASDDLIAHSLIVESLESSLVEKSEEVEVLKVQVKEAEDVNENLSKAYEAQEKEILSQAGMIESLAETAKKVRSERDVLQQEIKDQALKMEAEKAEALAALRSEMQESFTAAQEAQKSFFTEQNKELREMVKELLKPAPAPAPAAPKAPKGV